MEKSIKKKRKRSKHLQKKEKEIYLKKQIAPLLSNFRRGSIKRVVQIKDHGVP